MVYQPLSLLVSLLPERRRDRRRWGGRARPGGEPDALTTDTP